VELGVLDVLTVSLDRKRLGGEAVISF
jgi:hypothetical protein